MDTSIINIGDELLIGQVTNTNAAVMARMLTAAGFAVRSTLVVGDDGEAIHEAVIQALRQSRVVLLTGGLGPTKDDITKQVLCRLTGSRLVENAEALDNVKRIFAARGYELTPLNRAQALVPDCCEVLNNDLGTAPCMWFERDGRILVSLPGVPFEMEWLMRERVIPKLQATFGTGTIATKNILVEGIGESFLSDLIEPWETSLPEGVKLAYLPESGLVKLRLTSFSRSTSLSSLTRSLYDLAGPYIVGEDAEALAELLHRTLTQRGLTLATAESCTGGTLASRLAAMAGASAYLKGGVVAYSNEVKERALGVRHSTLEQHGAVSEETAREMAEGVRELLGADYAVATTGVAGPDGGTEEKPVGTVWTAIASPHGTFAEKLFYPMRRQQVIDRTANHLYAKLIRTICQKD